MTTYRYRHLLQITMETASPLKIGSGEKGIATHSPVVRDVNDLPFIPGTSLAGIIANALEKSKEDLMGDQGHGSRLVVTEAKLVGRNGRVLDGLVDRSRISAEDQAFLNLYNRLPIRQHVRIGHKGTAEDAGKFDEEAVVKGSRFCFEMELASQDETEKAVIDTLLSIINSPTYRIGAGTRSGFGEMKVVKCLSSTIDLMDEGQRNLYLKKSSRIDAGWEGWTAVGLAQGDEKATNWTRYELLLRPEDFLLFGSGFGDAEGDSDMSYVKEPFIEWNGDTAEIVNQEKTLLIPGTSVKGALSHRTAFYYNKFSGSVSREDGVLSNGKEREEVTGKNNPAVKAIFGSEGDKDVRTGRLTGKRQGNLLISDVLKVAGKSKIINHVSIDRFTGGAVDGALFQEQVAFAKGNVFSLNILVADKALENELVLKAFESALKDVVSGMLPLGGGVNRGNGIFTGTVKKFNKETKVWETLS